MKIKLGRKGSTEWTIYGENEKKECVMGICFPNTPTQKKISEIQRALKVALADI